MYFVTYRVRVSQLETFFALDQLYLIIDDRPNEEGHVERALG